MLGSTRIPLTPLKQPRQRRAWLTYNSILDAAARFLADADFAALTTNHVAELAGVGIGSLYEYFPDKETIVAELTRRTLSEMLAEIGTGLEAAAKLEVEPGVRVALHQLFDVVERRRELVRALWQIPFLSQLAEVKQLPKAALALARGLSPQLQAWLPAKNLEATTWLLTVMIGNAIVYGVAARPRALARREVEETLGHLVVAMLRAPGRPR